jgi:hypothetical protein
MACSMTLLGSLLVVLAVDAEFKASVTDYWIAWNAAGFP